MIFPDMRRCVTEFHKYQYASPEVDIAAAERELQAIEQSIDDHEPILNVHPQTNKAWISCQCGWDGRLGQSVQVPWDTDSWKNHIRAALAECLKEEK